MEVALTMLRYDFFDGGAIIRTAQTKGKVIVSALGYTKEAAYNRYRIFVPVSADNCIVYPLIHFFPMEINPQQHVFHLQPLVLSIVLFQRFG